jgi:hypothetical protein
VGVLVLEPPELLVAPAQLPDEPFRVYDLAGPCALVDCLTSRHLSEEGGESHKKGVSVTDTITAAAAAAAAAVFGLRGYGSTGSSDVLGMAGGGGEEGKERMQYCPPPALLRESTVQGRDDCSVTHYSRTFSLKGRQ